MPTLEAQRLRALQTYGLMDGPANPALDRITALVRLIFDAPMSTISLVDETRQWFASRQGVDGCQSEREHAFCAHALPLERGGVLVVEDAARDPRFAANPLVTGDPGLRFYAGAVLTTPDGFNLGTLCVMDTRPRPPLTALQAETLRALATLAMNEIEAQLTRRLDRAKQSLLQLAETMAGVGHWRLDAATGEVEWSDEVYRIHGLDRGGFDPSLDAAIAFYDEEGRAAVAAHVAAALSAGIGFTFQLRIRRPDGALRSVTARGECERDASGKIAAVFGVFQDVTEQADLLRQVSEERERYRLLAENANDMISTTTMDSTIQFVTPAVRRLLGYEPEELVGVKTTDLTHPDDLPGVVAHFKALLRAGPSAPVAAYQFRGRHKDGRWVWLEGQPRVQYDAQGAPVVFQDVVRDIAARKRMETDLQDARVAAEAAGRAKADFLANMSHELRTPLSGVVGFSGLVAQAPELLPETRRRAEVVAHASASLVAIVNDILDFSKFESEGVTLSPEPVDLEALLQGAIELCRAEADRKGLELRFEAAEAFAPVLLDPSRVRQVVLNLVGNAIKFTSRGSVAVSLARDPRGRVKIAVRDTGIGIPADRIGRVFDRFAQADATTSRKFGGTGLGLAICRTLVEAMGGAVDVHSVEGAGSTFWFTLDPPRAEAVSGLLGGAMSPRRPVGRLRVLLADDNAVNRELFAALLAGDGFEITSVANGAEAVRAVQEAPYDVVFMDVHMPVMDGLEATRAIRALGFGRLPIVALTANVLASAVDRCREAGMDDHLGKPYTPADVHAVLDRCVLNRPPPPRSPPDADPVASDEVLDGLRASLGAASLDGFLGRLADQLWAMAQALADGGEARALAERAHGVRGLAGTLGFVGVANAYAALERAFEDGDVEGAAEPAALLGAALDATRRGLDEIARRLAA